MRLPDHISTRLEDRKNHNSFRELASIPPGLVDFSSNDYLGFAKNDEIHHRAEQVLVDSGVRHYGATGSRLITGNHRLYAQTESLLASIHQVEACLIYPSGYMANLGLISAVAQRGDTILYDALCHASIRDGIRLSLAYSHAYVHDDLNDLEKKIKRSRGLVYVVTESVFSMDGDEANLAAILRLCETYNAYLVVDEAHSLGVHGWGKAQQLQLHSHIFARIATFGKAIGAHGAAVLGSQELVNYLINFSRPLIYTTGLPPAALAQIQAAYQYMELHPEFQEHLVANVDFYKTHASGIETTSTPIQRVLQPGNEQVRAMAHFLQNKGYFVKPILSPTVSEGTERIRICLHAGHKESEITGLLYSIHQWEKKYL